MPYTPSDVIMRSVGSSYRSWPNDAITMTGDTAFYSATYVSADIKPTRRMAANRSTLSLSVQNAVLDDGSEPANWQLAEGHFIPQKRAPILVYPRPDIETNSDAKHRRHYPGIPYRIPVGVSFGAWPFHYQLTSAPTGMTIGEVYGDENYGVMYWANPTVGTHSIAGTVTTQDLVEVNFSFTLVVETARAIFIDPVSGSDSNAGTFAAPFQTNAAWHLNDTNNSTYSGYHVYYFGGDHDFNGQVANNGNIQITSAKPRALYGIPGQTVNLDCSTGKFLSNIPTDFTVSGIRHLNADQTVDDAHFYWVNGNAVRRLAIHFCEFNNIGPGAVGDDNNGCVFVSNTTTRKSYFYYGHNHYENTGSSTNGVSLFDHYATDYTLFESNTMTNCNGNYGAWAKNTNDFVCFRNNHGTDLASGNGAIVMGFYDQLPNAVGEACWNTILMNNSSQRAISLDHRANLNGWKYAYRNTIIGIISNREVGDPVGDRLAENNIVVSSSASPIANWDLVNNVTYSEINNPLDSEGLLTGAARTTYLGTHGAEVA